MVIWLTGLPGSGKTTVACRLEQILKEKGYKVEILDGDEIRKNLSPELGFSKEERELHNKRVIYLAKILSRNEVVVIISLISPYRWIREWARREIEDFIEVYVKCPLEICIKRDPKGLYRRAKKGEIRNMTGLQHPYEEPLSPELTLETDKEEIQESVDKVLEFIGGDGMSRVSLELPERIRKALKERVDKTEFANLNEYILYILEQKTGIETEEVYTKDEEEGIKRRLQALGYL